ncbi:MAG TPA: 16S rRNA (guanine(966)-N(2))-methyltransferase RsmD [Candidatus Goldiibacteriota bacterium]|nr:16S rRNA (guanine(966)-N(2))-methyltransferase RsmD [Candidatus Goldiibacteriota bacterium]
MKISSGEFAGVPLLTPKNYDLRPTLSRTRQAIFNILRPLIGGSSCADFFCGTGALGLEAISNGAAYCAFVDSGNREMIVKNAAKLKLGKERYKVITCEYRAAAEKLLKEGFRADFIFADPPYKRGHVLDFLGTAQVRDILKDDGVLVIELHRDEAAASYEGWEINKHKEYGETRVLFLKKR